MWRSVPPTKHGPARSGATTTETMKETTMKKSTTLLSTVAAARELGATLLVEETENLARWYRVDLLPEAPVADPAAEAHPLDGYGLTSREREVLDALAAGHTNQEIATTLFISVKTASVHVSNILRKLDVPSRHEAARLAHRLGS